jgi:hypothetical protein
VQLVTKVFLKNRFKENAKLCKLDITGLPVSNKLHAQLVDIYYSHVFNDESLFKMPDLVPIDQQPDPSDESTMPPLLKRDSSEEAFSEMPPLLKRDSSEESYSEMPPLEALSQDSSDEAKMPDLLPIPINHGDKSDSDNNSLEADKKQSTNKSNGQNSDSECESECESMPGLRKIGISDSEHSDANSDSNSDSDYVQSHSEV